MREQGVDEARLRGEVATQRLRSAILARDLKAGGHNCYR